MDRQSWKEFRGSSETPDHIMLTLKNDPAHSRTVTWRTDKKIKNGFVLVRRADSSNEWKKFDASVNSFSTDMDESNYFFADLTGLEAETEYEYSCGSDEKRSDFFTFKTSGENIEKFTFLCLSDIQTGGPNPPPDYTFLGQFVKSILDEHPEIEFILTAGDNTNCGGTDLQWCGLFEGLKGIVESVPFMMSMGNHDDFGYEDYFTFKKKYYSEYSDYFSNQFKGSYNDNGPGLYKTANYSFDYGYAHFTIAGVSGYDVMKKWLVEDLGNTDKIWKFGVHHFPICYSTVCLENEDSYPALREGLEKCDVVLSGHEHCFARSYPRRNDGLYDKPSEGTIHYNLGSGNRNPSSRDIVPKAWNVATYTHEDEVSMYALCTVEKDKCTFISMTEDGRCIDHCVIDKVNDRIYPPASASIHSKMRLKYKGYDIGICNEETLPQRVNGSWYLSPGQLVNFIGGDVERTEGKIKISIYDKQVEFTENSCDVKTEYSCETMLLPCLRMNKGQLFVPVDEFCRLLNMHPLYFEHNNFISIESEYEKTPIPNQP